MSATPSSNGTIYTCPMHPDIRQHTPGNCPKCGMKLVPEKAESKSFLQTYQPLFTIVGLILLTSAAAAWDMTSYAIEWTAFMQNWMSGFFLVFSGFKLLNIAGFAKGYAEYDLLAKHWGTYGYAYPFLELGLGLLYLLIPANLTLNMFTLCLMLFSGIGVAIKLAKHEKFRCACLGTFIDVPLTHVTLVEDFGMAAMAVVMIIGHTAV